MDGNSVERNTPSLETVLVIWQWSFMFYKSQKITSLAVSSSRSQLHSDRKKWACKRHQHPGTNDEVTFMEIWRTSGVTTSLFLLAVDTALCHLCTTHKHVVFGERLIHTLQTKFMNTSSILFLSSSEIFNKICFARNCIYWYYGWTQKPQRPLTTNRSQEQICRYSNKWFNAT